MGMLAPPYVQPSIQAIEPISLAPSVGCQQLIDVIGFNAPTTTHTDLEQENFEQA
jgi:hypothetical protein